MWSIIWYVWNHYHLQHTQICCYNIFIYCVIICIYMCFFEYSPGFHWPPYWYFPATDPRWIWISLSTSKRHLDIMGDTSKEFVSLGNLLSARFALLCLVALVHGVFWLVSCLNSVVFLSRYWFPITSVMFFMVHLGCTPPQCILKIKQCWHDDN